MKTKLRKFLILLLCGILIAPIHAQVTIGSARPPVDGALLDMKEYDPQANKTTALRGLGLPRVNLTDKNMLFPMFDRVDGTNYMQGTTPYDKTDEDTGHTGLVVYNLNKCAPFGTGVFVWDGKQWVSLNGTKILSSVGISFSGLNGTTINPGLNGAPDTIHINSGLDKRGAILPIEFSTTWTPATTPATLTATDAFFDENFDLFAYAPWVSGANTLPASPHAPRSLDPEEMFIIPDIDMTPWKSRQWMLKYDVPDAECNNIASKTLILNQTNYAITVGTEDANGSPEPAFIALLDVTPATLDVYSNAVWKATATPTVDVNKVFDVVGTNTELNISKGALNMTIPIALPPFSILPMPQATGMPGPP